MLCPPAFFVSTCSLIHLQARDNLVSSAHGRPRLINIQDCTIERLTLEDFPNSQDPRNDIFRFYVSICGLLGDLCEMLMRRPQLASHERNAISADLLRWLRALPERLRLYDSEGKAMPYNFEVARLHVIYFTAVTVLYRPPSVYRLSRNNTAALMASSMNCHLFEAFQLRDQAHFLSGQEIWQLLVAAIPQLSSWPVPSLWQDAQSGLDVLEEVLTTLGRKLPSATNNLRNVRLLRSAIANGSIAASTASRDLPTEDNQYSYFCAMDLFESFGADVANNYREVERLLGGLPDPRKDNTISIGDEAGTYLSSGAITPGQPEDQSGIGSMTDMLNGEGNFYEGLTGFDMFDQSNWMVNWVFDQNMP